MGVKQLDQDPFSQFVTQNPKGNFVKGKVSEVDAKGAVVTLVNGVEGYIRASEMARERVEDARSVLKEGDEVEAKFIGIDRKKRTISLSIRAKESDEEASAIQDYSAEGAGVGGTLGDLLKEQMDREE